LLYSLLEGKKPAKQEKKKKSAGLLLDIEDPHGNGKKTGLRIECREKKKLVPKKRASLKKKEKEPLSEKGPLGKDQNTSEGGKRGGTEQSFFMESEKEKKISHRSQGKEKKWTKRQREKKENLPKNTWGRGGSLFRKKGGGFDWAQKGKKKKA